MARPAIEYAALAPYNTLQELFLFVRNGQPVATLLRECVRHVGSLGPVTPTRGHRDSELGEYRDHASMLFPVNKSGAPPNLNARALSQSKCAVDCSERTSQSLSSKSPLFYCM